jgi:hypothetical protein
MSDRLAKLKALAEAVEAKSTYEIERKRNMARLHRLFDELSIGEKVSTFDQLFDFTAINLGGISLNPDRLGEVSPGKYAQIIAIVTVETDGKRRSKNVNLRYFGRTERLQPDQVRQIVEFVLRWRFEKGLRGVDRYLGMLQTLNHSP